MFKYILIGSAVCLSNLPAYAAGDHCTDFTTDMFCFENSTTADANQVNANFQALLQALKTQNESLQSQINALQGQSGTGSDVPAYDSGWFPIETPSANQLFIKEHSLNAYPSRYWIWFSPDNPASGKIYPKGHGQPYNDWEQPHGIAFTKTDMSFTLLAHLSIGRYYEGTAWKTWNSGYWRILLWK
ncbi:hypothetical protein [Candidatus Venteria ishoeyi]|uniref:Uncharacterized protein n=1 Tax=Candidatus Venteria ishoeyi TaxID=1899563 RepID=A0A1H6FGW1_9GAMM|nr:hypothetical protein [Candidatus Venteria ishoeyi]SEH08903.1 Uncharacterised protein [Candidatus Venteria ishoeyi]